MKKPFYALSLIEAVRGIEELRFTAEEYALALLERIASRDEEIGVWAWFDPQKARQAARLADLRLGSGKPPGALEGIPVGVKDIFATAGIPTEMGCLAFAGNIPDRSALLVERIEAQGGFVIGKTVTAECAFMSPGKTRNPWNKLHSPGGSSSGSAAAVAAGFVPAAIGTQTNGSVIRPAAFCGIVGFKPTQGLLPAEGALTFSHTLDQPGLFTRDVADAAWFFAALAAADKVVPPPLPLLSSPPRLAAVRTPVWEQAEGYAKAHFRDTVERLKKGGAVIAEIELPEIFDSAQDAIRTIMACEAAFNLGDLHLQKGPLLSSALSDFIATGRTMTAAACRQALEQRLAMRQALESFLADYDAIITPPATGEAPADIQQTGNPAFCSLWSLCGVPAVSIPSGFGPGQLPLGLQIVGSAGKDNGTLAVAGWCEGLLAFSDAAPYGIAG